MTKTALLCLLGSLALQEQSSNCNTASSIKLFSSTSGLPLNSFLGKAKNPLGLCPTLGLASPAFIVPTLHEVTVESVVEYVREWGAL